MAREFKLAEYRDQQKPTITEPKKQVSKRYIDRLPSGFKPYPEGSKVGYYTYSFGEIKDISDLGENIKEVTKIIMEGIFTEGFDKFDLTYDDFMYVSYIRKLSSFKTSNFSVKAICPTCNNLVTKVISLSEISFDELEVESLPIYLDVDENTSLEFMPLTVRQYLENNLETSKETFSLLCRNLPDPDYINRIEDQDLINDLISIDSLMYHGMAPVEFKCNHKTGEIDHEAKRKAESIGNIYLDDRPTCGGMLKVELLGGEHLITPFYPDGEAPKSRIRYMPKGSE